MRAIPLGRLAVPLMLVAAACGGSDDGLAEDAKPVVEQYATIAYTGYSESLAKAKELDAAIDAFLADPSEEAFTAAKDAWKAARLPYRPTEVFRFYGGPIDDPDDEVEARINAWPLDEAFIDSVHAGEGDDFINGGIVNERSLEISKDVLIAQSQTSETSVTTGYHAIEFLLWGQDRSDDGPGDRPFTDYLDGDQGSLPNGDRRRTYLALVSDMLVADLQQVTDQWAPETGEYRAEFVAEPVDSLGKMLRGMGALSGAELPTERMSTAWKNHSQEDEHSCFSDTTLADFVGNAQGLQNVYLGALGTSDGPGLDVLVAERDPALDAEMKAALTAAMTAIAAIPDPFDQAIQDFDEDGTDGPGRLAVETAFKAVRAISDVVVDVGVALDDIEVNTGID